MKQFFYLLIIALNITLLTSCEKDEASEASKLQGVWELKSSDKLYEYMKIRENDILIYSCVISPDLTAAKLEYTANYVYDEKTNIISSTVEGETDNIEVVELTSSSLTLKYDQKYQKLTRVKTPKDLAPESVIGKVFGVGNHNYRFKSDKSMEVIDTWSGMLINTEILGEPSYTYTKTGQNTAILKMQYREKSYAWDAGSDVNVEVSLNLFFVIPTIGMVDSGNYTSNGMGYNINNGVWIPDETYNRVTDFTAEDFILR